MVCGPGPLFPATLGTIWWLSPSYQSHKATNYRTYKYQATNDVNRKHPLPTQPPITPNPSPTLAMDDDHKSFVIKDKLGLLECLNLLSTINEDTVSIIFQDLEWDPKTLGHTINPWPLTSRPVDWVTALRPRIVFNKLRTITLTGNDVFSILPFIDAPVLKSLFIINTATAESPQWAENYELLSGFLANYTFYGPTKHDGTIPVQSSIELLLIRDTTLSDHTMLQLIKHSAIQSILQLEIYIPEATARMVEFTERNAAHMYGFLGDIQFGVYLNHDFNGKDEPQVTYPLGTHVGWHQIVERVAPTTALVYLDTRVDSYLMFLYHSGKISVCHAGETPRLLVDTRLNPQV
ncbi:unnamed protein product [Cyclocybe aegerita]|uniref:Uncharacterized protein n=1 Tax=Cyclocybe aegerita TaxID=1973307 RepID=A0A8S0VZL8_CYCAE|nr:unnamed protein product [Cyclocybe aegerita]